MQVLPDLDEIERAAVRLRGVARHTPLVPLHEFDARGEILLKLETLQPITSFKIRGVFHAVARLSAEERARGLSTVSAGNTAQALAWSGRHFGVRARSIMPDAAPRTKIEAVERYGGEPVLVPTAEVFRFLRERLWEDEPYAFVHPWTNRDLMVGHATIGLEVVADFPDVRSVWVPVGGGGLLGGVGAALRASKPGVRIVAVEPEGCPALYESLRLGRPVQVDCDTVCDGVAVPYITDEMFPILREVVDDMVLVPERDVVAAVRRLALRDRIVVEPSAALTVAAILRAPAGERAGSVALVTGASIDRRKLLEILG